MHDLRDEVDDQQMVDRFAVDWRTAGLDDATAALLDFAEKLTDECAAVGREDVELLRSHGFDDQGISSCVQVVAYFNYINRIAEGLGVAMEDWIEDNGREKPV
ncbi:MAG TPA: peroxidase [Acidimicrobiia bacterium]|nr:peroxidase [Acidimicrobiia bacterium]